MTVTFLVFQTRALNCVSMMLTTVRDYPIDIRRVWAIIRWWSLKKTLVKRALSELIFGDHGKSDHSMRQYRAYSDGLYSSTSTCGSTWSPSSIGKTRRSLANSWFWSRKDNRNGQSHRIPLAIKLGPIQLNQNWVAWFVPSPQIELRWGVVKFNQTDLDTQF